RDLVEAGRNAGAAEILLRKNVDGDLRPRLRRKQVLQLEDDGTIRVDDPRCTRHELDGGEGILPLRSVTTCDLHDDPFPRSGPVKQAAILKAECLTVPLTPIDQSVFNPFHGITSRQKRKPPNPRLGIISTAEQKTIIPSRDARR